MLTTLDKLAEAYREQGKYAEAEPLYLKAIAIHGARLPTKTWNWPRRPSTTRFCSRSSTALTKPRSGRHGL